MPTFEKLPMLLFAVALATACSTTASDSADLNLHLLPKQTPMPAIPLTAPEQKPAAAQNNAATATPHYSDNHLRMETVRSENNDAIQSGAVMTTESPTNEESVSHAEEERTEEVIVEEQGITPEDEQSEAVAEDSELSPEDVADTTPKEGPVEQTFALCDDSVYMRQWESDFDRKWLAENSKHYRRAKDKNSALASARSNAFVHLVFPMLADQQSDYPIVVNRDVIRWIEYFQTRGRNAMVTWLKRGQDVVPRAVPILEKNGLPRDLIYLSMIESGFNNRAFSSAAAVGPWQFIRSTGKMYGLRIDDFVDERRDPEIATQAAARYLSDLYASLGDWHLASASYNAGEGRIRKALRRSSDDDFFSLSQAKLLPNETRNYVPKLIAALYIGKNPKTFGFDVEQGSRAIETLSVKLTRSIALKDLANTANLDLKLLENLNPSLRVGISPPPTATRPYFELRVPAALGNKIDGIVASLPEPSMYQVVQGRIGRRDTVGNFAARLGIPLGEFLKANPRLTKATRLAKGQMVWLPVKLGSGQYDKLTSKQPSGKKIKKRHHRRSSHGSSISMRSKSESTRSTSGTSRSKPKSRKR